MEMVTFMNDSERTLFDRIVAREDRSYDIREDMIVEWRGKNGYHSRLEQCAVHPVVGSLEYAYDLMCRDCQGDFERAEKILRKTLPLQDREPQSATFGIWPYFLEEAIAEMDTPDWNMADFNGKRIYQMLRDYGDRISPELLQDMREALLCACGAIMRRNVGPDYSNISIMGAYVTMAAGEYLENDELKAYALGRMCRLYHFNVSRGALQEYNSPSYTWIILSDLAAALAYIRDESFLSMAKELNGLVWRCLAEHFHFRTKQWAGPHSRFYGFLQDDQILMQIQRALNYRIVLTPLDREGLENCLPKCFFAVKSICPPELVHFFTQETAAGCKYVRYLCPEDEREEDLAASYLEPGFALGSFHKAMFWNQRRSHISYFGTEREPVYCSMKCLHDFYDFSSAMMTTVQDRGRSLTVFGFAVDGGDTHPDLDPVRDGCIRARDLRVRFELGGSVSGISVWQEERCFYARLPGCMLRITIPCAVFGGRSATLCLAEENSHVNETGDHKQTGAVKCLDIILYQGQENTLDFTAMKQCCGVIGFEILHEGESSWGMPSVEWGEADIRAVLGSMAVQAPSCACGMKDYLHRGAAWVDGLPYRELAVDGRKKGRL